MESLRRYEIATVRRRGGGRGPPAAHLAADLDFVSPRAATPAEAALLEAEVILVSGGRGASAAARLPTGPGPPLQDACVYSSVRSHPQMSLDAKPE